MTTAKSLSSTSASTGLDWTRHLVLKTFDGLKGGAILMSQAGYESVHLGEKDHPDTVEVHILESQVFPRILKGGSIAAGETYMEGLWRCSNLHRLLQLLADNQDHLDSLDRKLHWFTSTWFKVQHFFRRNHKRQAKKNILAHYDLGNDFYQSFLDPQMQYSSALFAGQDISLAQAQSNKLKRICEQLKLESSDHLLEIGTGWGGLAIYAASHYGCKVTTTTISDKQHAYVCEQIEKQDLAHLITVLNKDYRELEGQYDKLVSIEMIEAVGERYLPGFAQLCASRLKVGGVMLLQAITIDDRRFSAYSKTVDFIQQFIFPGGFLPSPSLLNQLFTQQGLKPIQRLEMGIDYADTLQHWHHKVQQQRKSSGENFGFDEQFYRLWHFYFAYCEAGFRSHNTGTEQLTMVKG
ncbi:cyclopropane-fatty-acyl-phospholipid synthase family protein [Agarivorans sp. TSD2052]|uniref:SAM-dependent methyltransferase n=1 Tax=Agarivorans sp. TSD2052 TaxID=2937286 RepID=UPI00200FCCBF|nr:cyclopropane-fatty-acyl-phospholipid synthase family protein [Agarivorans sp. TSD2052]UPW19713.1 cyclopropane-fatty-acyl-phospholipid synthase family protein [Agarivorans sp. TSD2052]